MYSPELGLSIIFNGEIYNHRELRRELVCRGYKFRSSSDTEVLLAAYSAWGEKCLELLNGMFAFCVYDTRRQRVFLARDRAGEKPLFYHLSRTALYFGSELKALLVQRELERKIDASSLACYLSMGYVPGERCILQGFRKLPPAHALSFDLGTGATRIWSYWRLPDLRNQGVYQASSEPKLIDELEALLEDAVSLQLVADVPVGVLLSGGVDSSLITAMAVRRSSRVRTFSIGFDGNERHDETAHARLVARTFGTEHTELFADMSTAELIPRLARQFDEPIVDSSMIPTWLVSKLVREHCTVALGGDGGDELFGGYEHYARLLKMHKLFGALPLLPRKMLGSLAGWVLPIGFRGRNWAQGVAIDLERKLPLIATHFDRRARRDLVGRDIDESEAAEEIFFRRMPVVRDLIERATRMDFSNYLAEDILVKIDRSSMMNSLEIRSPFLDKRVIEFAFGSVPSSLKAALSEKKILLKRLCERVLPSEFDKKRKQGFSVPMGAWLKQGPYRRLFWDVLTDSNCIFNRRAVISLLKNQDRGFANGERLFALVLFELWRRSYEVRM